MKKIILLLLVLAVSLSGCGALSGIGDKLDSLSQAVEDGALESIMDEAASAADNITDGNSFSGSEAEGSYSGFDNNDGTPIATGELTAASMIAEYPASVTIEKTEFAYGEVMKVTFTAGDWLKGISAWIGIVPADTDHGDEFIGDDYDLAFFYPEDYPDGVYEFISDLESGSYDLRFYSSDGGGIELLYIPFTVK